MSQRKNRNNKPYNRPPPEKSDEEYSDVPDDMEKMNAANNLSLNNATKNNLLPPAQVQPSEEELRNQFLQTLTTQGITAFGGVRVGAAAAVTIPAEVVDGRAVYFPQMMNYACAICLNTIKCSHDKATALIQIKEHSKSCAALDLNHDCLVCRIRLTPEKKADHFLSKGHADKIRLVQAKFNAGDKFAFYYTDKGAGQSKPLDGSVFKTIDWEQRNKTCDAATSTEQTKENQYFHNIQNALASAKNPTVASLTKAGEVAMMLDVLKAFASTTFLPCLNCAQFHIDIPQLLNALKRGAGANSAKYFNVKDSKNKCCGCNATIYAFEDPVMMMTIVSALKATLLAPTTRKATAQAEPQPKQ